jgi:hypothetical protein
MLKPGWPGNFARTITTKVKGKELTERLVFTPGVPVNLSQAQVEKLMPDIGVSLQPIEMDEKARPRIITDEVSVDETVKPDESQPVNN